MSGRVKNKNHGIPWFSHCNMRGGVQDKHRHVKTCFLTLMNFNPILTIEIENISLKLSVMGLVR